MAAVVFVLFRFIFGIGLISGDSMEPALHEGEFMFFRRICYTPERGDVVLCRPDFYKSRTEANEMLLKRVIAVGGDTIDIDYETGDVLVNGAVLEESYIAEKIDLAGYTRENPNPNYVDFPYTVDEGCVFVMGDNRNYSIDSRLYFFGEVPKDDIVGKLLCPQTN
ncbi:MAG: signal peptidase I [Oscillospiraceae bacterium]|nr:signal peptidase I [Oscillospiraceae bacterium]